MNLSHEQDPIMFFAHSAGKTATATTNRGHDAVTKICRTVSAATLEP